MPEPGAAPLVHRPVVVGSGPAGLVAAYFLAEAGYRPLVLERGQPVGRRIRDVRAFDAGGPLDPESNYLFGEGGAGTFSDGKLTCRNAGPDVRRVLELFAACKGKPSLLYEHRLTWAVTVCRRWSRPFAGASKPWAARSAFPAASRTWISRKAGSADCPLRPATSRPRQRCWRSATVLAILMRCWYDAASRWYRNPSRWASAWSTRRRPSTAFNMVPGSWRIS